jgi:hypothetical protein
MDSRIQKWIRESFYGFVRTRMDSYGFANPRIHTKRISFLTTRIVDSFRRLNSKLPVSWFGFVESFLKYPFRGFVSWNFFSQITRFVSFRKDSYTNPASLINLHNFSSSLFRSLETCPSRSCSVYRNFHNQLTKIFDAFQLIEKFDQLPKNNLQILALDRKF